MSWGGGGGSSEGKEVEVRELIVLREGDLASRAQ